MNDDRKRHMAIYDDYADRVRGANGVLDLLELIDGRSYKLQCRSAFEIGRLILCGRGSINSKIVTIPRYAPSPFGAPTDLRTRQGRPRISREVVQRRSDPSVGRF